MVNSGEMHRVAAQALAGPTSRATPALLLDGERMQALIMVPTRHAGSPVVVEDALMEARLGQARYWCKVTGLCSLTAIALRRGGVLARILLLSSWSKSIFEPQLTPLLAEPGADLSFAPDNADRERKRQAAVLVDRARRSAEDANRAKSKFMARMSHELCAPLNAILGFAQLLATNPVQVFPQDQAERVRLITLAAWHLLGLVNDVMDISRSKSRRCDVGNVCGNISWSLDEAVALTQPITRTYKVALAERPTSKFGVGVLADRRRLLQVLLNLLSTACKFKRPGGHVRIEVAYSGSEVFLDAVDNGVRLMVDHLSQRFEPFNRLGNVGCAIEGSGLGLTLARQRAGWMNRRIEIESTPESETRARLVLQPFAIPLKAPANAVEIAGASPRMQNGAVVF